MNDAVSSLLIRQLDLAAARQQVIAHNLANYGTPAYSVKGESFEGVLGKAEAAAGTAGAGRGPGEAAGGQSAAGSAVPAGAAAQGEPQGAAAAAETLELQMARLADNTGRFSALARILTIRERAYENAVRGR